MKRILLGAVLLQWATPCWVPATTFDPIGLRGAARELGIGFGQGYHSKPMPAQLRPHYERVTNYQAWRVCPPPAYPAAPTAPVVFNGSRDSKSYPGSYSAQAWFMPKPSQTMVAKPVRTYDGDAPSTGFRRPGNPTDRQTGLESEWLPHSPNPSAAYNRPLNDLRTWGPSAARDKELGPTVRHFSSAGVVDAKTNGQGDTTDNGPGCSETQTDALLRKLEQYETEMEEMGLDLKAEPLGPHPSDNRSTLTETPNSTLTPYFDDDYLGDEVQLQPGKSNKSLHDYLQDESHPFSSTTVDSSSQPANPTSPQPNPQMSRPQTSRPVTPRPVTPRPVTPREQLIPPSPFVPQPTVNSRPPANGSGPPASQNKVPNNSSAPQGAAPQDLRRPPEPRSYGNPNVWW